MEKINSFKLWKQDPSKGEVFTPIVIINKKLDRIPEHIWTNPKSTFCDLSMGKGTYLIEVVNRLVNIYDYSEEDAKSRVFGYDIRVKYVNFLKRRGYKNVFHKDSLEENFNMKFDVVLGNPPYQKQVGLNKTEPIWHKFVEKSFEICKQGGYISLIHPSGWRNVDGKFKDIQKLILSKNIKYLEIHNEKDGLKLFGAETRFDWYVIENINKPNENTIIVGQRYEKICVNLEGKEFIPNDNINIIYSLVAKNSEPQVQIINNSMYHHQRKFMSKTKDNEFKYPIIYTVKSGDVPTLYYSNRNDRGHFDISKLIWSNFRISSAGSIIDINGKFAMTEFSSGLVESPKNLPLVKKVFDSKIFRNLMEDCAVSDMSINRKIIATFRKDFWKEFLDEDGNIIEPNFNENVESI